MDGIGNNRFASNSPFTPENAPQAPPPPAEVKVRTMRSDLASMAKSGGGLPKFANVKVAGLSVERRAKGDAEAAAAAAKPRVKINPLVILAAVAAAATIGVLGYVGYRAFSGGAGTTGTVPPTGNAALPAGGAGGANSNAGAGAATSGPATAQQPFTHASLFKKPADETLTLTLAPASATSSASLETFGQKLITLLATASRTATMLEIAVKDANGNELGVSDILSQANETVLASSFITTNFNPDATLFVYRDGSGLWPGYVLSLQTGKNWLFLASSTAGLESSPSIGNFFLSDPGPPAPGGFTDGVIASTTVRMLAFPNAAVPTYFVYGWLNGDLILSTSRDGFAAAVARLAPR